MIHLSIDMPPMGKQRPEFGMGRAHTPTKTRQWERDFMLYALQHKPRKRLLGPLHVDVLAVKRRPGRLGRKADPGGLIWAPVTPDQDNIRKIVLDALSPYWRDDAQIVGGTTWKCYAEKGRSARVEVWIWTPGPPDVTLLGRQQ